MPAFEFPSKIKLTRFVTKNPIDVVELEQALHRLSFSSIDDLPQEQLAQGYVSMDDIDKPVESATIGNYFIAIHRKDVRKPNGDALKRELNKLIDKEKANNPDKPFVSRERKKELKENVTALLMTKTLPKTTLVPVIADMLNNYLYIGNDKDSLILTDICDCLGLQEGIDIFADPFNEHDGDAVLDEKLMGHPDFLDYLWAVDRTFTPTMAYLDSFRTTSNIDSDITFARSTEKRFGKGVFELFLDETEAEEIGMSSLMADLTDTLELTAAVKLPKGMPGDKDDSDATFLLQMDWITRTFDELQKRYVDFINYDKKELKTFLDAMIKEENS